MLLQAAVRVSGLELGGLVGSLIAGRWSDAMIRNDKSGKGGNVGKRVQVRGGTGGAANRHRPCTSGTT